jgi:hypothetical protein
LAATAEEMSSQTEQQQNVMTFFKLGNEAASEGGMKDNGNDTKRSA